RASDTSTALGGLYCRPRAVRSRLRTTTMRTKLVVMITIDGASDSTVIRPISWTTRSVRPAPVPRSMLMAAPEAASWARAATGQIHASRVAISDSRAARLSSARVGTAKSPALLFGGAADEGAGSGPDGDASDIPTVSRLTP